MLTKFKNVFKRICVHFNLLPAYELVDTNKLLDDWVEQPRMDRKTLFVDDDYVHPAINPFSGNLLFPQGYRPEADAEFRERIKSLQGNE